MEWPPATGMPASAQTDAPPARMSPRGLDRQLVHRHADDRQRQDRRAAHGVDIRERVGRGDAAELERVVDDRHEEIGGRDHGLTVVEAVDGGVVRGLGADQQFANGAAAGISARMLLSTDGRQLAAAAAAMRQIGQSDGLHAPPTVTLAP